MRIDAGQKLDRALPDLLAAFGAATITRHETIGWASATFTGARHHIRLALQAGHNGPNIAAVTALLAEADVPIPGHLVADIALVDHICCGTRTMLEIEALTLIDS